MNGFHRCTLFEWQRAKSFLAQNNFRRDYHFTHFAQILTDRSVKIKPMKTVNLEPSLDFYRRMARLALRTKNTEHTNHL